jgi:LysM repeat protein
MGTKTKDEEKDLKLSNEFKEEIIKERKSHNWLGIFLVVIISLLLVGSIGLGAYQIFFKGEKANENVQPEEKIKSTPSEQAETPAPKTETPAAETPKTDTNTSETSQPAVSTETTYTIVEGDTLGAIAEKFGTTVSNLMALNNISDETTIQIGQKLKLK